ncbi:MAG TPA: MarR family transcriptional regulator [Anaerolineales bacterium]|jgi:DNA-binding MarR family transcriptional regulator
MKPTTTQDLTRDLFQLMKKFPHLRLKHVDGLTPSEQELLVSLSLKLEENRQVLTVTEISNLLQITPAGVTHLLNPLEEAGYIERRQHPTDRRIVPIGLTEKGSREAEAQIRAVHENLAALVNFLGEEDSRTFTRLLSKVVQFFG